MTTIQPTIINAVIYREGDYWIAQGLEYDICAQALTVNEVNDAFEKQVVATAAVGIELGREPFDDIAAAPKKFWDMFSSASVQITVATHPYRAPKQTAMPRIMPNYKLHELAA